MKTYPYNRSSVEGRRLFKLLDVQFNKAALSHDVGDHDTFSAYQVPSVMQCRANRVDFLFPSNLSGLKRPQIRVKADVEMAWGDFTDRVTALDFTHGQELPLTYVQPIDDETLKLLIDAGLYRDTRFEELMSKLMMDEVFDAEASMSLMHLDVGADHTQDAVPVLLVEPVYVVHEEHDPSEHTTIASLVKRSAQLAIALRKEGVKTDDLMADAELEQSNEVFIADGFRDVVTEKEEEQLRQDVDHTLSVSSDLLDQEIDVTEQLKGSLSFDHTSEDDRIRDLKGRDWSDQHSPQAKTKLVDALDPADFQKDQDISDISDDYKFESEDNDLSL